MAAATVVRGAGRGGRCEYPFVDSGWDVIDIGSPEAGRRRAHLRYIDFPSEKISAQTTVRLAAGPLDPMEQVPTDRGQRHLISYLRCLLKSLYLVSTYLLMSLYLHIIKVSDSIG